MSHAYLQILAQDDIFSQSLASVHELTSTSTLNFSGTFFEVCELAKVLIGDCLHILCFGCGIMIEPTWSVLFQGSKKH